MCLHNPDCYIFHTRCRSCPYVSQFQHAKCACIIRTVIFFIQEVSILSLCQPVLACKMCLHNPDCYIFQCRSCPYASQFQHAKCACIIRTVIFSYKVSILSLCQPVLACKMCLHNPDCYIFHTKCRSCPYASQFQHAKCACIIRTVIFSYKVSILSLCQPVLACKMCLHNPDCYIFHTRCRSCPYVSQFQHAKCACIIRTVIFFIQGVDLVPMSASSILHPDYVSQFQHAKCACIIRTVIFFIQSVDLVPMPASRKILHPDCMVSISQFQHAKCACIIRTVIFSYKVSILSLCQPVLACKMCLHNPDCYIFHTRGVDLVLMSASFSMQNVLA